MRAPLRRLVALPVLAALAAAAATSTCSGGDSSSTVTVGSPTEPVTDVEVVAPGQRFEPSEIFVPAGEEVDLAFENDDRGIAHNLRVRTDAAEDEQPATDLEVGPDTQRTSFTLEAGEYRFVCDIHPDMRGTITAV